jgi:hypothetical protein
MNDAMSSKKPTKYVEEDSYLNPSLSNYQSEDDYENQKI